MEASPEATSGEHHRSELQPSPAVSSPRQSPSGRHLFQPSPLHGARQLSTSGALSARHETVQARSLQRQTPAGSPEDHEVWPSPPAARRQEPRRAWQPQPRYTPGKGARSLMQPPNRPPGTLSRSRHFSLAGSGLSTSSLPARNQHSRAQAKVGVESVRADPVFHVCFDRPPAGKRVTRAPGKSHPGPHPP
ncbi:hypothetical protein NDU88_006181 [Pleurodeles waltl]|uniref:Uncharacterized protein n=1 Tax=Pleurodeles waltl TaxID=8319 RepID=A0AAV7TDF6_PLEWA|nr:hypothetical protein NDU88_006181 [Pleurodeles waltl]